MVFTLSGWCDSCNPPAERTEEPSQLQLFRPEGGIPCWRHWVELLDSWLWTLKQPFLQNVLMEVVLRKSLYDFATKCWWILIPCVWFGYATRCWNMCVTGHVAQRWHSQLSRDVRGIGEPGCVAGRSCPAAGGPGLNSTGFIGRIRTSCNRTDGVVLVALPEDLTDWNSWCPTRDAAAFWIGWGWEWELCHCLSHGEMSRI